MNESGKPKVAVINNLARAGGTLINRCIGCMQDIMMFSEIHPVVHKERLVEQAQEWFGLLSEIAPKGEFEFNDAFKQLSEASARKKQFMVLRDWSHVDFMAQQVVNFPCNRNRLLDVLKSKYDVRRVAIIRHPIDQWLSMHRLAIFKQKTLPVAHFLDGYLSFLKMCCADGFIKYESITAEPDKMFAEICQTLGIPFDPSYRQQWSSYDNVTGDIFKAGRANNETDIMPLPRAPVERETLNRFLVQPQFHEIIKLTGYEVR